MEHVTIISDEEHQEHLDRRRTPSEVLPFLYIGDQWQARDAKMIKNLAITHILNVNSSARYPSSGAPYKFLHVPLSDFGDDDLSKPNKFPKCFKFMEEAKNQKGKILVHCSQGVNRSPTVVVGYLVVVEKWSLKKAYTHVQQTRSLASPHEKYFLQLQQLEQNCIK